MGDYAKLVRGLRETAETDTAIFEIGAGILIDAADAIEALTAQGQELLDVVKAFLALPEAKAQLDQLDRGIGTKTCLRVWTDARAAISKASK